MNEKLVLLNRYNFKPGILYVKLPDYIVYDRVETAIILKSWLKPYLYIYRIDKFDTTGVVSATKLVSNEKEKEETHIFNNSKHLFVTLASFLFAYDIDDIKKLIHPHSLECYAKYIKEDALIKLSNTYTKSTKYNNNIRKDDKNKLQKYNYTSDILGSNVKVKFNRGNKMKSNVKEVMNKNNDAAQIAAKITAGKSLNSVALKKVRPMLPMVARGYVDSPLANIVLANIVNFLVLNFAENNNKAVWISEAMMTAAMTDFFDGFDIEALISEIIDSASIVLPEEVL